MAHAQRAHAKFSFSNAHRWMKCYGQPNLLETVPELQRRSTKYSNDGTFAHEVLEAACRSGRRDPLGPPEIWRSVCVPLDYKDQLSTERPDMEWGVEQSLSFPQTVVPQRDCGGIADIIGYSQKHREGHVIDYKHGAVPVDAENNAQLWAGATAAFWDKAVDNITLTIVQPNGFHGQPIKSQRIHASDLLDFAADVSAALEIAKQPDAPLVPGDHCRFCDGAPYCLARDELFMREFTDIPDARRLPVAKEAYPNRLDFSPERTAAILKAAPAIKAWLNDVASDALEKAIEGAEFPGFKLVETQAQRKWTNDHLKIADELVTLSNYTLTIDDVMPRQLINITDAEKRLKEITNDQAVSGKKRQAIEDLGNDFAFLTTRSSSGNYTLVPESSNRPAVKPAAAAFAHVHVDPPEDQSC